MNQTKFDREIEKEVKKEMLKSALMQKPMTFREKGKKEVTITKEDFVNITEILLAVNALKSAHDYQFALFVVLAPMINNLILFKDYDDDKVIGMIKARQAQRRNAKKTMRRAKLFKRISLVKK